MEGFTVVLSVPENVIYRTLYKSLLTHVVEPMMVCRSQEGRILRGSLCTSLQPGGGQHVQTSGLQRLQDRHRVLLRQQRRARRGRLR